MKPNFKSFCVLWLLIINGISAFQNFTGHKLLGMVPRNSDEVKVLRGFLDDPEMDFWLEPTHELQNVTVHVNGESGRKLESTLHDIGLQFYTITDDLEKWIEREREENYPGSHLQGRTTGFAFDVYHPLDEIVAHLDDVSRKYPNLTKLLNMGDTFEGNIIYLLKISSGGNDTRPAIWIDAGIHSREWIAPATALYMINHLLVNYGSDRYITNLIDTHDWYIMPLVNPDGYLHTWNWNRLWRKNRALTPGFPGVLICRGIDPNRNFDIFFGGPSTSSTPCSSIYKGDHPFSEAESSAIRDGVMSLRDRLLAYFSLHSFSQLWMTPHGYTTLKAPDFAEHMELLTVAITAVEAAHGMHYRYGPSAQTLYATSGSASDWVYDVAGVRYSFSVELRDRGVFGFLLPRTEIIPTSEETWAGISAIVSHLQAKEKTKKSSTTSTSTTPLPTTRNTEPENTTDTS
ncbi:carboxypeptidase A2 [Trichonephila inaurata madagascariensis]|uniref:Carboxypeptidase A2 n=1 Tax=Trichonephila inaurata madagascariensis TaxID=2747483 RepID=A0A8X6X4G2_9ARAC|nr:carboxypeptidase A2 [Trichonephila inaurata madagascariensis]